MSMSQRENTVVPQDWEAAGIPLRICHGNPHTGNIKSRIKEDKNCRSSGNSENHSH